MLSRACTPIQDNIVEHIVEKWLGLYFYGGEVDSRSPLAYRHLKEEHILGGVDSGSVTQSHIEG